MTTRLLTLLVLLAAGPAAAQYQLTRSVIGSGVTDASGGAYSLKAVVGEPAVGTAAGGAYVLCQGFWCAVVEAPGGPVSIVIGGSRGNRYLGPPAAGITVDDLAAQNLVRGVPGYYPDNPGVTLWTEFDPVALEWVPSEGTGEVLELGKAFKWYLLDRDGVGDPTISESVALPFTLSTDLEANTDDVLLELDTSGNRFNFLANPFGRPLDLSGASSWPGGAGIRSAIYVYDESKASWELASGPIQPWEAFRFRAAPPRRNGNPRLLIIPASAQTVGVSAPASRATAEGAGLEAPAEGGAEGGLEAPAPRLAFRLEGATPDGRALADGMLSVAFADPDAAAGTADEPVEKFQPPTDTYALLGVREGGRLWGHAARPFTPGEVPLALEARGAGAEFTLSWDASALPPGLPVVLVDLETGAEVDVRAASSHTFRAARRPALADVPQHDLARAEDATDRFVLRIGDRLAAAEAPPTEVGLEAPVPNPSAGGARVAFAVPEAGPVRLAVFDVRGREVAVLREGRVEAGRYEARLPGSLAAGVYVVRLEAGAALLTERAVVAR